MKPLIESRLFSIKSPVRTLIGQPNTTFPFTEARAHNLLEIALPLLVMAQTWLQHP